MELSPEIVNFVMSLSTEEVEFLGSIIENEEYEGISINKMLIDSVPSAKELFGNQFGGSNDPDTFKYIYPNVAWGSASGTYVASGKLLSIYPIQNKIPSEFLGETGEITTNTTSWAIGKVKTGEMSAKEAITIIRQRTNTIGSETRYFSRSALDTNNPPNFDELDHTLSKNTDRKPFDVEYNVDAVNFKDPYLSDRSVLTGLKTSIGVHMVMRYRAEARIDELYNYGRDVENGLNDGSIKMEIVGKGETPMSSTNIPYTLVQNEFRETILEAITERRIAHPEFIKKPFLPTSNLNFNTNFTPKSAVDSTIIYMAYCQAGIDADGNLTPTKSSQNMSNLNELIKNSNIDPNQEKNKGFLYGVKTEAYGGILALALILHIISRSASVSEPVRFALTEIVKGPTETILSIFKFAKNMESEDVGRLIRDYIAYKAGHAIAHPHGFIGTALRKTAERTLVRIVGQRLSTAAIPYFGWYLAIACITWDILISPAIDFVSDRIEQFNKYTESISIQYRTREDGTVEAWCLDPGLYLYLDLKVERPVLGPGITTRIVEVTDDGLNESIQSEPPNVISTSPIIGVKRDPKTGKAIIDSNKNIIPIYDEDGTKPKMDNNPKIIAGEEISDYRINEPKIQSKINSAYIKDTISKQESISLISRSEYIPMDMGFYAPDPLPDPRQDLPPEDIDPITPPEWDISYDSSVWINNWTSGVSLDVLNNPLSPTGRTQIQSYPYNSTSPNVNANGEPQTPSFYGNETFTIPAS